MSTTVDRSGRSVPRDPIVGLSAGLPQVPGLVRPRVVAALDRVLRGRLCVVVGIAGTGKTTALAHWAAHTKGQVAWHRATPGTDLVGLVSEVATRRPAPVLVIDDFHRVARRADCELLEELLLATPMRLVVASRAMPPFNLARSELPARVVDTARLRFDTAETTELFATYDAPLTELDAAQLTRHTAGWPAALNLFRLRVEGAGPEERHHAVTALATSTSYVADYLRHEVLAELDPADLSLLERTSLLELLRGEWCDALLGTHDAERRLRALGGTGLLVEEGTGFRLHPVVRSHLLAQLRAELGSAAIGVLQRRRDRLESGATTGTKDTARLSWGT